MSRSKEDVVQEYRVQSIQDAAMRVIARKGMAAATMQEIAEEAGVAKGTIYLYFRDRDELVERTFERAIGQLLARMEEAVAGEQPFVEKLRAMVAAKIAFFDENREFFRLYTSLRMAEGTPQQQRRHKRKCEPQYQTSIDRFATLLGQAMERGELRPMDRRRLALFLAEGSNAIVLDRVLAETAPPAAEDVDFLMSVILDGIRERSPRRDSSGCSFCAPVWPATPPPRRGSRLPRPCSAPSR